MSDAVELQPFVLAPGEGEVLHYLGGQAVWKINAEQTGGWGFAVETSPPGFASALHRHPTEDSGFYILSGAMRVRCGDLDAVLVAGSFAWLPRGVAHAFRVEGNEPCSWINVQGPTGDFHRLVKEVGTPTPPSTPPVPLPQHVRDKHQLEVLGPSPFTD